jgi:flagellin
MSILISNSADAAHYLKQNQQQLQKSLKRLSSGKKIIGGGEDPGGLAVSMKINASIKRLAGAESNVQNGISFLEVQDGILETIGNIVTRVSELKGLISDDPLKSGDEKASYQAEFVELCSQFTSLKGMAFNGVSLFSDNAAVTAKTDTKSIAVDDSGTNTITISLGNLQNSALTNVFDLTTAKTLDDGDSTITDKVSVEEINAALDWVSTLRAGNGSGQNRLQFMAQSLSLQKNNMTAALSRIEDIDLAEETANLAKYSIMTQASAAMVAQANSQNDIALMLLS